MIVTTDVQTIWINIDNVTTIAKSRGGNAVFYFTDGSDFPVDESFDDIMAIVDPMLEGDTPEEIAANLIKRAANVPLSLLKRVL